jgi:diguanylate cyclase (GGDEF)-like protein/PAS domain S-box-containing protein
MSQPITNTLAAESIRVLLVEDEPGDAELVQYGLRMATRPAFEVDWVQSLGGIPERPVGAGFDVVLLDLSLPDSTGLATVEAARRRLGGAPIIILTGHDDDELALAALEAGAQDYLIKGEIDTRALIRAIRYAISRIGLEHQLVQSEARMAAALDGARLGLWDWRLSEGTVGFNSRWGEMLGLAEPELEAAGAGIWEQRIHEADAETRQEALNAHLRGETERYAAEFRLRHRDGGEVWVLDAGHVIERDDDGTPVRMVGVQQDITDRKRLESRLEEMATTDPLTGLANRRRFLDAMASEYARLNRGPGHAAGLLMLDIDHFKRFNDRYGHEVGDAVLVDFSRTVEAELRGADLVGRLGGEEFAVLLTDTGLAEARKVGEKLRRRVAAMTTRAGGSGETLHITTSVGVTVLAASDAGAEMAFQRADAALYRAKEGGRDRVEMDAPEFPEGNGPDEVNNV